jgi:hypothetical protein
VLRNKSMGKLMQRRFPIDTRDVNRQESVLRSHLMLGRAHQRAYANPHRDASVREYLGLRTDEDGRYCTKWQQKTHITDVQEVRYCFHPWYGQLVLVEAEAIRSGAVIFRCRRDDGRGFPVLEIPHWMFDSQNCAAMEVRHNALVSCMALRDLQTLLDDARHPFWISGGGGHAEAVEEKQRSTQVISEISSESGVIEGSQPEDRGVAGANAARARGEMSARGEGGGS